MTAATTSHTWRFSRIGGLDQVHLDSGSDLLNLEHLDQKLWVALACPVKGLEFDERTLALLDLDHDGRVRAVEMLQAVAFCKARLVHLDGVAAPTAELPLHDVDTTSPDGQAVHQTITEILRDLDKPDAATIALADVTEAQERFNKQTFNGDGVILPAASDDEAVQQVLTDAIAVTDGVPDRSGETGVDQACIDRFFEELAAVDAWHQRAADDAATVLPLGDATTAAAEALQAIRAKVDDYFARCRLAAFDPRTEANINHAEADYAAILATDLSADAEEIKGFPLARVEAGRPLPLADGINPAWASATAAFRAQTVTPLLGELSELTAEAWGDLKARLAPHLAWAADKPSTKAHDLGIERVRAILAAAPQATIAELIAKDSSFAPIFDGLETVEKLVRLHRDLMPLARNFVSFETFYKPDERATFEAGTLFLDGRSCTLCIRVGDPGKHAALAGLSKCYLAYCDLSRQGGEKMQIAAVFSGGDSDYLMVGRNGVFYDRAGKDWDATITRIVENPISIRQAFFAPYKRFLRFVEEQVAKRASTADASATSKMSGAAQTAAAPDQAAPAAPKLDLGTLALIGVVVTGAAAVVGGLLEAFFGLGRWMPIGLLGLILLISGPSMLIAALKLRQRTLGPILDANGWAINGRVRVNIPFGGSLTHLAQIPEGAERSLRDPYAQKRSPWIRVAWAAAILLVVGLAGRTAYHQGWMPQVVASNLSFLGVPHHLVAAKDQAHAAVVEAREAVSAAQEHATNAATMLADLRALDEVDPGRLARARARAERTEAKLARAQARLDRADQRLDRALMALETAEDAEAARQEELERAEEARLAEQERADAERRAAEAEAERARLAEEEQMRVIEEPGDEGVEPEPSDEAGSE